MRCEQALESLSDYLEQSVSAPLRVALEDHYSRCQSCNRELVTLRQALALFADPEPVEVPAGFRARVLARAEASLPERRTHRPTLRRLLTPASLGRVAYRSAIGVAALAILVSLPQTAYNVGVQLGWLPSIRIPSPPERIDTGLSLPELSASGVNHTSLRVGRAFEISLAMLPHQTMDLAKMTVTPDEGLELETRGVAQGEGQHIVWQGSALQGQSYTVPLRLRAVTAGVHVLRVHLADSQKDRWLWIYIPVDTPAGDPTATLEGNLPLDAVFRRIAADLHVVIATDNFHNRRQPISVSLSRPARAIQQICQQQPKLDWSLRGDVINVHYRPT